MSATRRDQHLQHPPSLHPWLELLCLFAPSISVNASGCVERSSTHAATTEARGQVPDSEVYDPPDLSEASELANDCAAESGGPERISLAGLLAEAVDLRHLAQLPNHAYRTHLASSHDRASDNAGPSEPAWYANADFTALVAGEPMQLLDVDGPGSIVRIWSAAPAGILRIYLDGSDEPAIETPLSKLLNGETDPFVAPFGFVAAGGGHNLYFPIPFARHCRVTLTSDAAAYVYYQITYRQYSAGTDVESFDEQALSNASCERDAARARLLALAPDASFARGRRLSLALLPSASPEHVTIPAGPVGGVLTELRVLGDSSLSPDELRQTMLIIAFDGEETVRAPVAEFFAVGHEMREVNALPIGVSERGELVARWPMPFEHEARIALHGNLAPARRVELQVVHGERRWTDRSLYLHAAWRAPSLQPAKPLHDWTLSDITGDGIYVGSVVNVYNPVSTWWGEGDEKIWVDDEPFPSQFGTGTEDYFGFAYCSNQTFTTAYVGQLSGATRGNLGFTTLYRFHVLDPIRFTSSLRFDLEVQHWDESTEVAYDALSVWYARAGSNAHSGVPTLDDLRRPDVAVDPPDAADGPYDCAP